ncbi:MAG: gamma-glutamylcyclotransferase [Gammaproteobacteria bacterium]|nr:gamma-glutamylcyclotransferase [Gammaproteobacteria bacterium]
MSKLLYFAYGSNMSMPRLTSRVPSARAITSAKLVGHNFTFHKISITGSGKCHIACTNNPDDIVWGIVFEILAIEKILLDEKEDLGRGYNVKQVSVSGKNGEIISAFTYYGLVLESSLKPFIWYKEHVLRGAEEHDLPPDYIKVIQAFKSIPDPDKKIHEHELSIYRQQIKRLA